MLKMARIRSTPDESTVLNAKHCLYSRTDHGLVSPNMSAMPAQVCRTLNSTVLS